MKKLLSCGFWIRMFTTLISLLLFQTSFVVASVSKKHVVANHKKVLKKVENKAQLHHFGKLLLRLDPEQAKLKQYIYGDVTGLKNPLTDAPTDYFVNSVAYYDDQRGGPASFKIGRTSEIISLVTSDRYNKSGILRSWNPFGVEFLGGAIPSIEGVSGQSVSSLLKKAISSLKKAREKSFENQTHLYHVGKLLLRLDPEQAKLRQYIYGDVTGLKNPITDVPIDYFVNRDLPGRSLAYAPTMVGLVTGRVYSFGPTGVVQHRSMLNGRSSKWMILEIERNCGNLSPSLKNAIKKLVKDNPQMYRFGKLLLRLDPEQAKLKQYIYGDVTGLKNPKTDDPKDYFICSGGCKLYSYEFQRNPGITGLVSGDFYGGDGTIDNRLSLRGKELSKFRESVFVNIGRRSGKPVSLSLKAAIKKLGVAKTTAKLFHFGTFVLRLDPEQAKLKQYIYGDVTGLKNPIMDTPTDYFVGSTISNKNNVRYNVPLAKAAGITSVVTGGAFDSLGRTRGVRLSSWQTMNFVDWLLRAVELRSGNSIPMLLEAAIKKLIRGSHGR